VVTIKITDTGILILSNCRTVIPGDFEGHLTHFLVFGPWLS